MARSITTGLLMLVILTTPAEAMTLKHDLAPLEDAFIGAADTYGIDPVLLAAIATLESDHGRSRLARERNNLFGWRGSGGYMAFDSQEDCIDHVAKYLAKHYLDSDGIYYNGATVEGISVYYCGGNQLWVDAIKWLMMEIRDEKLLTIP